MINDPVYGDAGANGETNFPQSMTGPDWFSENAPPSAPTADAGMVTNPNQTGVGTGVVPPAQATAPTGGSFRDPAYATQFVSYWANQPGANPSLKNDPAYWIQKLTSGELGSDPNYITSRFLQPEGAPAGGSMPFGSLASSSFQWPSFTPPGYTAPTPYRAPTLDEAAAQPGYAFAAREGRKALDNSAAARGVLRTGGHLKDLYAWGDQFATQNYGNVLKQSEDIYKLNADQGQNTYQNNYQNAVAAFNPSFESSKLNFNDLYSRWRDSLNSTTQVATAGAGL